MAPPAPALTTLPAHILCVIFAYLPCEDRKELAQTCKLMAEIAREWRVFSDMEVDLRDSCAVEFALRQRCRSVRTNYSDILEMYAVCYSVLRSQGNKWPISLTINFGCAVASRSAVRNFQRLGSTLAKLALMDCSKEKRLPSDMGKVLPVLSHLELSDVCRGFDLSALADPRAQIS